MPEYYVNQNPQSTGEHEVHAEGCSYMPISKLPLGWFSDCHAAVEKARDYYKNVDGCYYCSNPCHTR
jgi:hypothetical protein